MRPRLVLDTGALIALERGDERAFEHLINAGRRGYEVVTPILAVVEAQKGSRRPARLNQVLKKLQAQLPLSAETGGQIAGLQQKSGVDSDTDVVVVVEALAVAGSHILTSDPDDILAVLRAAGGQGRVPIHRL